MNDNFELEQTELEIIDLFLNQGFSIRKISERYNSYGRTKIKNILKKYASLSDENRQAIELKLYNQKTHRKAKNTEEMDFQKRVTKEKVESQPKKSDIFAQLSREEQLNIIYTKLNERRVLNGRKTYKIEMLERKANRLLDFFEKRNEGIENPLGQISEYQVLKMLYDYPTLLSLSLNNKIRPTLMVLEKNANIGKEKASKIITENPAVLGTTIERTKLQLRILKDTGTLKFVLEKPRILRTSPELMYAQIRLWKKDKKFSTPFVSNKKLYELYNKKSDEIEAEYRIQDEYGDDEYFDSRI